MLVPDPVEFDISPVLLFGAGVAAAAVFIGFFKLMSFVCERLL